jgi:hypothetical protein
LAVSPGLRIGGFLQRGDHCNLTSQYMLAVWNLNSGH